MGGLTVSLNVILKLKFGYIPCSFRREGGPSLEPRTAGYHGPGCSKCAVDFARTDSNVFICMKCVAWLLLKGLSWHRYAASNICKTYFFNLFQDFWNTSMCMSGYEFKRTGRKTVHLAIVAPNVRTWTQICMHACKRGL